MRIAVDAMGGDYAPKEIVLGALRAARQFDCEIVLVGDEDKIKQVLAGERDWEKQKVTIRHAAEVVEMDEHPADAVRQKKDSSVVVATRLVKDGECDAVISAGSTGAAVAAAQLVLKRIKGIKRPSIATPIPTPQGATLMLDSGANVDSKPIHLLQSALMGSVYSELVYGHKTPRVGLLNIGEEETKGDELARETYPLLRALGEKQVIHFTGNAEGRDIPKGNFDVVVCDGFVGNVVLKTSESLAPAIGYFLKKECFKGIFRVVGALLLKGAFKSMKQQLDPDIYGGAPLLGVPGAVIITHGSSSHKAIYHAVRVGANAARNDVTGIISREISEYEASRKDL
jgi:glycerol-3-phosphate acyltransferase PlsX